MTSILETERLYLRAFTYKDAMHLYAMNNDPEVIKYTGDRAFKSLKEAQDFVSEYIRLRTIKATKNSSKESLARYAVIRKEDDAFLGWCGLKLHKEKGAVDIGFRFYKKYWKHGYATESARGCISYAFSNLQLPFLIAHAHVDNAQSRKVLEKCNMIEIEKIDYDNNPSILYRLDNEDYTLREIVAQDTWPVRHPVLRAGRPLEDVYMEADEKASTFHLGMYHKHTIVGVASFMEDTHEAFTGVQTRLRGMAVLPEYRNKGIAAQILNKGEEILKKRKRTILWFNARTIALGFYKNLGYTMIGEEFDIPQVGPHVRMKKDLI
ncbi:GNAT family N-acetyltransferase [Dokdonia sp. R86516]|uniref:GNAT family N-acetyltransferase n=1 Tax=Dokdonia sp. R86516 TaxID=3093856 RepID=UPI0037C8C4C6